jgi:hypothetical protein
VLPRAPSVGMGAKRPARRHPRRPPEGRPLGDREEPENPTPRKESFWGPAVQKLEPFEFWCPPWPWVGIYNVMLGTPGPPDLRFTHFEPPEYSRLKIVCYVHMCTLCLIMPALAAWTCHPWVPRATANWRPNVVRHAARPLGPW